MKDLAGLHKDIYCAKFVSIFGQNRLNVKLSFDNIKKVNSMLEELDQATEVDFIETHV